MELGSCLLKEHHTHMATLPMGFIKPQMQMQDNEYGGLFEDQRSARDRAIQMWDDKHPNGPHAGVKGDAILLTSLHVTDGSMLFRGLAHSSISAEGPVHSAFTVLPALEMMALAVLLELYYMFY